VKVGLVVQGSGFKKKGRGQCHAAALKALNQEPETLNRFLQRLGDVSGTDAAGADLDGPDGAVPDGLDLLEVGIPYGTGFVVGMADVVAEAGTFTTYCAYS
jgi:hypothetical protein